MAADPYGCAYTHTETCLTAASAILWLMNDNGLVWTTEGQQRETIFHPYFFEEAC
jgi:hypothetical protein